MSKSNQFNFYKKNYDYLTKENQNLKNEIIILNDKLDVYSNIIRDIKNNFNNYSFEHTHEKILFVLHEGFGGTLKSVKDLINNIHIHFDCYLLVSNMKVMKLYKFDKTSFVLVEEWKLFSNWLVENGYSEEYSNIYFNILIKYNFNIIHIHHLIFHTFDLPKLAKIFNIPVVLSLHDFYFICPSFSLLDENYTFCEGKCNKSNEDMCYLSPIIKTNIKSLKLFHDIWQKNVYEMFSNIDIFISPSLYVKNIFNNYYSIPNNKFKVIEHGFSQSYFKKKYFEVPSIEKPTKILFLGNLNIHKGSNIIKQLYEIDKNNVLEFHFLGKTYKELSNIGIHHGEYNSNDLAMFIEKIKPSFVGIFSIWSETYCYTLSEAWSFGIPVLISKIGVLRDRFLENGGGWFIDINDMNKTYDHILSIIHNNEEYINKQKEISNIKFKSIKEMSEEYLLIYESLEKK